MNTEVSWAMAAPRSTAARTLLYRLGRLVLSRYGLGAAAILLLAGVNCFWHLSSSVVSDLDEARYGVAASEMLRSHSALVATYAGRPEYWNLKPPLGYWMQEFAFRLLGPTVFAMRVPSAICALALIGLTVRTARQWYGRREAWLAGLVLTTCFGFMSYHGARSGDLDSALSLILFVATIQVPELTSCARARLVWAAMLSLGFLLKSFAILPFVLVAGVYVVCLGHWRQLRIRDWVPGMLLFLAVVAGWMLARVRHDGSAYFVARMFREDLLWRSTRVLDDETVRPWGYVAVLLERFAPWPLLLIAALAAARKGRTAVNPRTVLLLLWALVPLTAFSLARTQHHWYLDPTYAAWSMLTALAAMRLMRTGVAWSRLITLGVVLLSLVLCEVRVLRRIGWTDRRPAGQTFLMSLRGRLPTNGVIYASFPLSHSERFILEVVDGYRVEEEPLTQLSAAPTGPARCIVLLRRRQLGTLAGAVTHPQLIDGSFDYALLQIGGQNSSKPVARGGHIG